MVGVPGKYKGCETCRRRRVKCSNERPFCKKCVNSGRECEGYERERVFITGTLATKGRVASHPKKSVSGQVTPGRQVRERTRSSSKSVEPVATPFVASTPLSSAWEDRISLSSQGSEYSSSVAALRTDLKSVIRTPLPYDYRSEPAFSVSLPPYTAGDLQVNHGDLSEFKYKAHCLTNCQPTQDGVHELMDHHCVFLYEHNSAATPSWMIPDGSEATAVRNLGPAHFQRFPNHHFFARVYRPMTLAISLINRKDTFLAMPDWTSVPWELHPKSLMDQLIDVALYLPSLLASTDELLREPATLERRARAKDLLQHCLAVEQQFDQWLVQAVRGSEGHSMSYWPEDLMGNNATMLPFAYSWSFKDGLTGTMFMYYWMTQIPFHHCINSVHHAIFEVAIDAFPDDWPPLLPIELQIDTSRYQQTRELAANICRGLDAVLETTAEPDLLLGPLRIATDFFRNVNATTQDAMLETIWLEAFGDRLRAKGQMVSERLQGQRWSEISRFGEQAG